jgi:hypothetical protein
MHASFHFINQILQLTYTTQAYIFNLKLMQCKQAHDYAHIKCKTTKFMSLLFLLVCFSCPRQFWSISILQCCSLLVYVQLLLLPHDVFSYLCSNFSPFVINFHKRCASYWYKGLHWGRWLTLESCFFYGHYQICWNNNTCSPWDTSCKIFDLDTNWWDTSSYVIAWVIHLINLSSC